MIDWRKIVNTEYVGRTGAKFVRRLRIHIENQAYRSYMRIANF